MTPEKIKQYKVTLGLLGIHVELFTPVYIQFTAVGKAYMYAYNLVFNEDSIHRLSGGRYIELREEEVDEIIQKYVDAKGKYDD